MFDPAAPACARIFAQAPGCDFPRAVAAGLRARLAGQPPQALAQVTIYVNNARMQARLTEALCDSGASFLPRISLVADLAQHPRLRRAAPPAPLRRQLQIGNLVARLLAAQPDLAPRSAAFDLALSLDRLLNEMQGEGVPPSALTALDVAQHAAHWARAQAFLSIVAPLFADDQDSAAGRQRQAVAQLAAIWAEAPPPGPVLVVGTTGSRRATAEFMHLVCGLPQGGLILPGYDFDLPQDVWAQMNDVLAFEDHPQFRFRRLMDRIGFAPADVRPWHAGSPAPAPQRNRLISLSLRPAPVTDQWLRDGPLLPDLRAACLDMTLIEAPFARSEAAAIALILRQAAEAGEKAALITPDRSLVRQVTAALDRWGILPDDSAGRPLSLSAAGRFLRHIAALMTGPLTLDLAITVLKHPLCASGGAGRGDHLLMTRQFELHLRRHGPSFPTFDWALEWAGKQANPQALPWVQAIAPLFAARQPAGQARPLADLIAAHLALAQALARGAAPDGSGALWQAEPGEALHQMMDELSQAADAAAAMTPADYRALLETLLHQRQLREAQIAHPQILIWGTIEARAQGCDLVILGGLNDAVWPPLPNPDPWLNRKMRRDAGLLLPERQIGLSAHDYQQAIAAPRVVLSRALRNAESETIPSRWLNRLVNLMQGLPERGGPAALAEMRARGAEWLALARALDRPAPQMAQPPSPRPSPAPPPRARPAELPLTAMEQLIANPYHVYARYILGLRPLPPLHAAADARDRGTVVHRIVELFAKSRPIGETLAEARARLMALAQAEFAREVPFASTRALWLAKFARAADAFLHQDRKSGGMALAIEQRGRLPLAGVNFTLTGTPDRIDRLPDGTLHLIDYKTGKPPSEAEQKGHRKQLLFAAVMAQQGGFAELGPSTVTQISYISLGSDSKTVDTSLTPERLQAEAEILQNLVAAYLRPSTGYTARRADFNTAFEGDYDHLMRFGEWQTSDGAVLLPVGQNGGAA